MTTPLFKPAFGEREAALIHADLTTAAERREDYTLHVSTVSDLLTVYTRELPDRAAQHLQVNAVSPVHRTAKSNPDAIMTVTPGTSVYQIVQAAAQDLTAHYAARQQTAADPAPTLINPHFDQVDVFGLRDDLIRATRNPGSVTISAGVAADLLTTYVRELPDYAARTIPAEVLREVQALGRQDSAARLKLDPASPALLAVRVAVTDLAQQFIARKHAATAAAAPDPVQAMTSATFNAAELHAALTQPSAAGDALVQLDALPAYALARAVRVRVPSGTALHTLAGALQHAAATAVLAGQSAVQVRADLTRTLLSKVYAPAYSYTREEYAAVREQVRGKDILDMPTLRRLLGTLTAFTGTVPSPLRTLSAMAVPDADTAQVGRHLDTLLTLTDVAALTWDRAVDGPARPWPLAVVR